MSTATARTTTRQGTGRPTFVNVLHSEWVKLTSLPSTWLALVGIVVIGLGAAVFLGSTLEQTGVPSEPSLQDTIRDVNMGLVLLGQIIAGALGVMSIGVEYSSGTIQPTLVSVPTRLRALAAKSFLLFATVTAVSLVTVFAAWAATNGMYAQYGLDAPLTEPTVVIALVNSAIYLGLVAVFGVAVGTIVRSTTIGVVIVFFVTMLGMVLASLLPSGPVAQIFVMSLLGTAGESMSLVAGDNPAFLDVETTYLSPLAGLTIAVAWTAVASIGAAIALKNRDA